MDNHSSSATILSNPMALIGSHIKHKFVTDDSQVKWHKGTIVNYDNEEQVFEIIYEGDDDHYFFDLSQDVMLGDLVLID